MALAGGVVRLALACGAAMLLLACGSEEPAPRAPSLPVTPRATLSVEPPTLRIGEVVRIEVVVVTPPAYRVLPPEPPEVPGLWLLDAVELEPERGPGRWVHRTRLRVRPRDLGVHEWPPGVVHVENASGERLELALPGRSLEVVSILPEMPDRGTPYGLREPAAEAPAASIGLGPALAAGATGALLAVLLLRGARRARAARARRQLGSTGDPEPELDLWQWAERELRSADASLGDEPRRAANRGARVLRQYVERRFGADIAASTTPELEATTPPLAMRSRWPYLVRILESFDEARFRPVDPERDPDPTGRIRKALEETRRFVEDSVPRGVRS